MLLMIGNSLKSKLYTVYQRQAKFTHLTDQYSHYKLQIKERSVRLYIYKYRCRYIYKLNGGTINLNDLKIK